MSTHTRTTAHINSHTHTQNTHTHTHTYTHTNNHIHDTTKTYLKWHRIIMSGTSICSSAYTLAELYIFDYVYKYGPKCFIFVNYVTLLMINLTPMIDNTKPLKCY